MAEIEKKVDDLTLNPPAADKPQGKPKEKKAKKPAAEGSYPLEVLHAQTQSVRERRGRTGVHVRRPVTNQHLDCNGASGWTRGVLLHPLSISTPIHSLNCFLVLYNLV